MALYRGDIIDDESNNVQYRISPQCCSETRVLSINEYNPGKSLVFNHDSVEKTFSYEVDMYLICN